MKLLIVEERSLHLEDGKIDVSCFLKEWPAALVKKYHEADIVILNWSPCPQVLKAPGGLEAEFVRHTFTTMSKKAKPPMGEWRTRGKGASHDYLYHFWSTSLVVGEHATCEWPTLEVRDP